ncbi:hypothetical protein GCM10011348_26840 [Marinobacterium nitratireducens]|uniref:Uncharacterized protein n=1 Tax=Marinobacterium nitratireducens TaxID=518897 RepID=A0A917ZH85_9GAMM|nr:hypothetical protein [Marinobacterium nitratireducens]GGO83330.1 hypothetical protein GCM10011348_26840 [Marinobacterium nitratireducens]
MKTQLTHRSKVAVAWSAILLALVAALSISDQAPLLSLGSSEQPAEALKPLGSEAPEPVREPSRAATKLSRNHWDEDTYFRDSVTAWHEQQPLEPAQQVEVPETFPLFEADWRDALPEETGLEPDIDFDPVPLGPEPLDDPWGGEWGDLGGSSG